MAIFILNTHCGFPSPDLSDSDGLLAVGGDLCPERLLAAYRMGIFPWYSHDQPLLWWSPDPRLVLYPDRFHLSKSLSPTIRRQIFNVTMDTAFPSLIRLCADSRLKNGQGTWITDDMIDAYCMLHDMGYAHSIEVWKQDRLVGGLYGVSLGGCFFGESMFSVESNASKVSLAALVHFARHHQLRFIDCQVRTRHLISLGAVEIPRSEFLIELKRGLRSETLKGKWCPLDMTDCQYRQKNQDLNLTN
jgi:leucyl/phenylalanyl-tRNA--protein transferase